jgi:hypothetical protein
VKRPHIEKPAQCLAPDDTAGIEPIKRERWPDARFRGILLKKSGSKSKSIEGLN